MHFHSCMSYIVQVSCEQDPCGVNMSCSDDIVGYSCNCLQGFEENDLLECQGLSNESLCEQIQSSVNNYNQFCHHIQMSMNVFESLNLAVRMRCVLILKGATNVCAYKDMNEQRQWMTVQVSVYEYTYYSTFPSNYAIYICNGY